MVSPAWPADEPPPPNTGALSFTAILNIPTSYYFRGIAQSNAGFQFQPYLELKVNLYEGGEKEVLTGGYLKAAFISNPSRRHRHHMSRMYLTGLVFKHWRWKRLEPHFPGTARAPRCRNFREVG
jgi:hypothetical protein